MLKNLTILLLYNLRILAPDQKSFCFFEQLISNFRYKSNFWLFFEQIFERLQETFWPFTIWSIDSCRNRIATDQYHIAISRAHVSTHQGDVIYLEAVR